ENKEARRPRKQRKEAGRMKEKQNTVRMRPAPVRLLMSAALTLALLLAATILACVFNLPARAKELPDLDATGSITVELLDATTGAGIGGVELELYLAAAAETKNGDYWWSFTGDFAGCAYSLDDLTSRTLPAALTDYVAANHISPTDTARTGEDGSAFFADLQVGLYLIVQTGTVDGYETLTPFLVTVPLENEEDGSWIYNVEALPKPSTINPETEPVTEAETDTTEPVTEAETDATEPVTESETDAETDETEPVTESETSATESVTESETDATEPETDETKQSEAPDETGTESEKQSQEPSESESESTTSVTTDSVQTGDQTPIGLWITVLLTSAAALLMVGERKHQRRQR
ncbi:MAG: hypothetical protein LUI87_08950, partial [Lachnospiraceae bacterium]|nr:hypothetical protein [Lachnospiraceae bacterium]